MAKGISITEEQIVTVLTLLDKGKRVTTIADVADISTKSVYKIDEIRKLCIAKDWDALARAQIVGGNNTLSQNYQPIIRRHYGVVNIPAQYIDRYVDKVLPKQEEPTDAGQPGDIAEELSKLNRKLDLLLAKPIYRTDPAAFSQILSDIAKTNHNAVTELTSLRQVMTDVRKLTQRFETYSSSVVSDTTSIRKNMQSVIETINTWKSCFNTGINAVNVSLNKMLAKMR